MGNCCKKRKSLVEIITSESQTSKESRKNEKSSDKNIKEKNENNYKKEKINDLILKENRMKVPESEEKFISVKKVDVININKKEKSKYINQKLLNEYKDILTNYIKFRKNIELKCEEKNIYVIKKSDNEQLIGLYNQIKSEKEDIIEYDELIEETLNNFLYNKEKINKKFNVMDFKMCEEGIKSEDNKIDLLNDYLSKKLDLKQKKGNKITYINYETNGAYRYLIFNNKKQIKISIIGRIFSLDEIIEENNLTDKYDLNFNRDKNQKNIISSINTNTNDLINNPNFNMDTKNIAINNRKTNNIINKAAINLKVKTENINNKNIIKLNDGQEKIDVKIDEIKSNENIKSKEKNNKSVENNLSLKVSEEHEEKENNINEIILKILILFNIQNIKIKEKQIYYLCNKNIINKIIQKIKVNNKENKDINLLIKNFLANQSNIENNQIIIQQFKDENIKLFENKYNFNNMDKDDFILEKKEIIYNNNEIIIFPDFILVNLEIYELLLQFLYYEQIEEINKIFHKIYLLKFNEKEQLIVIKMDKENNIYICEKKENEQIIFFKIIFLLFYNSKEIYLNEYNLLEKKNFDIHFYLEERKLNENNYSQNIFDENNKELGFFINFKKTIEQEKKEEKEEEEKEEEKEEEEEEKKEEIEEEKKVEKKEEKKEEKYIENLIIEKNEEKNPNKPIGLTNINSNSYLNSFLQCLYHITELSNFFLLDKNVINLEDEFFNYEKYIILNSIEINKDSLSFKYIEIIYHLYHKKKNNKLIKYYSPKNLLEYLQNQEQNKFAKNKENNPKKLCVYFIEKLKQELKEKENIKSLELENESDLFNSIMQNEEIIYKKYLNDFKFNNNSIIDKIFTGIKLSSFTCEQCNESEHTFKDFYYLNFSLENVGKNIENKLKKIDLNECFKYYFNNQKATQICKQCGKSNNTYNFKKIYLSPKILVLFLENVKEKGSLFQIDIEIDINEYLKEKNKGYKLIGSITYFKQSGSTERYYAYCYSNEYKKWFCFVDEYIYEVN